MMKSMRAPRNSRQAFTLVELLVVIAILAILIALLLPALDSAKKRAYTARCANNMRQVGAGFHAYLNDRNGYFPYQWPESPWDQSVLNVTWSALYNQYCCIAQNLGAGGGKPWSVAIKPYVGGQAGAAAATKDAFLDVMQCRANRWRWSDSPMWNGWAQSSPVSGYSMNLNMFPYNYRCSSIGTSTSCGGLTAGNPFTPEGWDKRVNMQDIKSPSAVAIVGEQPVLQNTRNLYAASLPNWWGVSACSATNIALTCNASWGIFTQWRYPDCNGLIATFHNLGMNALLVDGHVEWLSKQQLLEYSVQVTGTSNPYGPNTTPGGLFWTDGKGMLSQASGWYHNQFPGGPWPE